MYWPWQRLQFHEPFTYQCWEFATYQLLKRHRLTVTLFKLTFWKLILVWFVRLSFVKLTVADKFSMFTIGWTPLTKKCQNCKSWFLKQVLVLFMVRWVKFNLKIRSWTLLTVFTMFWLRQLSLKQVLIFLMLILYLSKMQTTWACQLCINFVDVLGVLIELLTPTSCTTQTRFWQRSLKNV